MRIFATFANRQYDPEITEMIDAWDEFCADENYQGFLDSRDAAIKALGDDLLRWVTVTIDVNDVAIFAALNPEIEVKATIVDVME